MYRFHCCMAIACGVLMAAAASTATAVSLENVRTAVHPDYTRVVLDLSGPTRYQVFTTEDPLRLIIDIEQIQLSASIRTQAFTGTPIKKVRSEVREDSTLRLVFDLSRELETNTLSLAPYLRRGDRIVIDFYARSSVDTTDSQAGSAASDVAEVHSPAVIGDEPKKSRPVPPAPKPEATPDQTSTSKHSPIAFSGTWEQEWAVDSDGSGAQKFEAIVQPRLDVDLPRNMRLTAIARLRGDTVGDLGPDVHKAENYSSINGPWYNNAHSEFSLRELYLDAQWGESFWRLGKQQVVWGQADGIKVMDVVNPQSFREFIMDDFDDSRIPLWMVNVEIPIGEDGSLQLLWIPDTTYHELAEAGTPYTFTSPRLVPEAPAGIPTDIFEADKPGDALDDSDAGIRYSTFLGGWDVTLNYLYHYQDFPVPYQQLRVDASGLTGVLAPEYERNHLMGGTLSNVFGNVTLRTELVYNTDTYHVSSDFSDGGIGKSDEFASVIGLDWHLGSHDTLLSAQWFQSHLLDHDGDIFRGQTENNLSLLYRRDFSNETWIFEALGLYSPDHGDRWMQFRLSHTLRSNLEIWLGGDFFGGDKDGLYGQYSNEDRVLVGMELGF